LVKLLGVGEDGMVEENVMTTTEILSLVSCASQDPRSWATLLQTCEEMTGASLTPRQELALTVAALKTHLVNANIGLLSTVLKIKAQLHERVVGVALSSSTESNAHASGPAANTIDILMNSGKW
jgi:hypothetical protein